MEFVKNDLILVTDCRNSTPQPSWWTISDQRYQTEREGCSVLHHTVINVVCLHQVVWQCFGDLEGKEQWQLQKAARKAKQPLPEFTPTGGETVTQVEQRAAGFFAELCSTIFLKVGGKQSEMTSEHKAQSEVPQSLDSSGGDKGDISDMNAPSADEHNHVLLVAHGGLIRTMIQHFASKFGCDLNSHLGRSHLRPCPNTGVSRFTVSRNEQSGELAISCNSLFNTDHLQEEATTVQ